MPKCRACKSEKKIIVNSLVTWICDPMCEYNHDEDAKYDKLKTKTPRINAD